MDNIDEIVHNTLTEKDYELESTSQSLSQFKHLLKGIQLDKDANFVDIGCGAGGFTKVIQKYFNLNKSHGIDKNKELLRKAQNRDIITHELNIIDSPLPFDDCSIDFVTCLGTLEHLPEYDTILKEIKRILKSNGIVIFALPNLGSWINRICLLGGWQPRNVEISNKTLVNTPPWCNDDEILYHIRTPTFIGFIELLKYYNYTIQDYKPLFPYQKNTAVKVIDYLTLFRPQLSRRFGVVAKK